MSLPLDELLEEMLNLACKIQAIPAFTNKEQERAHYIHSYFAELGLKDLEIDEAGNVIARIKGVDSHTPLVVSAHLDTVHSNPTPSVLTPGKISGPGIGDNSLGLAAVCLLAKHYLQNQQLPPRDLWLVCNVCEEGLGNLRGMRAVVKRFGAAPKAYIILEGIGVGEVFHRALGVERIKISITTEGGHSWSDYGKPSAIHEITELLARISVLPLVKKPRTTLNIGTIHGGTSINTIAASAEADIDLRSEDPGTLERLLQQVTQIIKQSKRPGVQVTITPLGSRPAGQIPADHPLVLAAQSCLTAQGISPTLEIGSTDANIPLSLNYPAVCIGLTTGENVHTTAEFINTPPLKSGVKQLLALLETDW
jgi:acetylornithine deacetylase/succinyl-diaminopimelate desuccinylase-like protein